MTDATTARRVLYYECTVTLGYEITARRIALIPFVRSHGFRVVRIGTVITCEARSPEYDALALSMRNFITALHVMGYTVLRYKIEAAVLDSRMRDELQLLKQV